MYRRSSGSCGGDLTGKGTIESSCASQSTTRPFVRSRRAATPTRPTSRAPSAPPSTAMTSATMDTSSSLSPTELAHEEVVLQNPHDVEAWRAYLDAMAREPATTEDASTSSHAHGGGLSKKRILIHERAVRHNPNSYKAWYFYLKERVEATRGLRCDDVEHERTISCFERALATMHKMPRVWELYLRYLMSLKYVTRTRRACDAALCALPVTQHDRVWAIYLEFVRSDERIPGDTARRVYRRYLKFEPGHAEEYVEFLKKRGYAGETAAKLAELVDDDAFQSLAGKSKHAMWLELCDIITKHPAEVHEYSAGASGRALDVDAVLRGGIRAFSGETGRLWTALADYYIRRGLFEKARDVYEEGMESVSTVRDFSLIFDAYAQFEESVISAKMENEDEDDEQDDDENSDSPESFVLRSTATVDLELRLARLEHLMERRPILLSSVVLRQNPHNVHEWEKRVALFEGDPTRQIVTYSDAVKAVNPHLATGRVSTLWINFAKFYETHGDYESAETVFEKAVVDAEFKSAEDLAAVWCERAEMAIRRKAYDSALDIMRRATTPRPGYREPRTAEEYDALPARDKVFKSLKMWTLYVDLEESLGDLTSAKKAYDAMIALRVATPQIILNYAHLLKENNYFEDCFQIYERGVDAFKFPYSRDIWLAYLATFVDRFKGTKLERARDLYEQVLTEAPPKEAKQFYLAYAALEERYGLGARAMDVYERATTRLPPDQRLEVYDAYVAKAMEFFGVDKVRAVFSRAADDETLPRDATKTLTTRFAEFERKLGELDRARALYAHASQFANPLVDVDFWSTWHEFEVRHGNEDTFREMLRVKRAVAASFSDTHFNTTEVAPNTEAKATTTGAPTAAEGPTDGGDAMARLDAAHEARAATATAASVPGFVRSHVEGATTGGGDGGGGGDDAEIDLGDDDDDAFAERPVPTSLFGGTTTTTNKRDAADAELGAAERFKRAREDAK